MLEMTYTTLVTVAALAFTFALSGRVGAMRPRHGIDAPSMTGHPDFERANRTHYNTIEQLVLFLPFLWLATGVIGDLWAAALGCVWLLGRIIYAISYQRDPAKRTTGMLITLFPTAALAVSVLWGVAQSFLGGSGA